MCASRENASCHRTTRNGSVLNYGTNIDVSSWLGVPMQQDPFDALAIAALVFRLKPDLIVETGTFAGGSSLFLASLLRLVNPTKGRVLTIDPWRRRLDRSRARWSTDAERLWRRHVTHLAASSLDAKTVERVAAAAK